MTNTQMQTNFIVVIKQSMISCLYLDILSVQMICLHSVVPLGKTRHSDLMIYGPKGSIGLLRQISDIGCLNLYYVQVQQNSWNVTTVSSSFPVKLVTNLFGYNKHQKGNQVICFLSEILNCTHVLTPHFPQL